ncbi:hypothetical protein [Deinococcus sp.]|uniref:hypothetical protein n=1 Tax=Deinococcus sp. TaxID=47478 RepID=UPI0025BF0892|nr:hypothetical protein [Deinococcus sp.]
MADAAKQLYAVLFKPPGNGSGGFDVALGDTLYGRLVDSVHSRITPGGREEEQQTDWAVWSRRQRPSRLWQSGAAVRLSRL